MSTPQTFLTDSPKQQPSRTGAAPTQDSRAPQHQPRSTRFESAPPNEASDTDSYPYTFSSRSPSPHHLAVLARLDFVRAACHHSRIPRVRLPSALPNCCDNSVSEVFHLQSEITRLMAHMFDMVRLRPFRGDVAAGKGATEVAGDERVALVALDQTVGVADIQRLGVAVEHHGDY